MANDLVPHESGSVEYYSPSSGRVVEVHHHHHHHHYITVEQPKSDDGFLTALKTIGGIVGGIGALLGGLAALNGANNAQTARQQYSPPAQQYSQPVKQYSPPVQRYTPPPPRCWYEPRREYLGRFFTHREEWPVYDQYGRFRGVRWRDHYVERYRNYQVRVCD